MLPQIPRPQDYDVSPETGFVPSEGALQRLSNPIYAAWESIISDLHSLLLTKRLRPTIDKLPVIQAALLNTERECQRAFSILGFIAHAYIWGDERPSERLPPPITVPLLQVSARLEILPSAVYSAVCLWNFRKVCTSTEFTLGNITALTTYNDCPDEQWFYLICVAVDAKGGPTIPLMLEAIEAVRNENRDVVIQHLKTLEIAIDEISDVLWRIYERCDPHVFYHKIRPFLSGSNTKHAALPRGVLYDDGSQEPSWRQYAGASAVQSSLIPFIDIVLGVEHHPTRDQSAPQTDGVPQRNFIQEMRAYMPGAHRRFLQDVEKVANIKSYVDTHPEDASLSSAYNACLAKLVLWRSKHIQVVSRYVVVKAREAARLAEMQQDGELTSQQASGSSVQKPKGTGGTALIPFLKQAREETAETAVKPSAHT